MTALPSEKRTSINTVRLKSRPVLRPNCLWSGRLVVGVSLTRWTTAETFARRRCVNREQVKAVIEFAARSLHRPRALTLDARPFGSDNAGRILRSIELLDRNRCAISASKMRARGTIFLGKFCYFSRSGNRH